MSSLVRMPARAARQGAKWSELPVLERFVAVYDVLDGQCLHLLDEIYTADVVFEDPFARLEGLDAVHEHFAHLYANVTTCRFTFEDTLPAAGRACIQWRMHLRHPRLRRGAPVVVPGASVIRFGQRVHYHRDYFDARALLYENVPLLGPVVRNLRQRMSRR